MRKQDLKQSPSSPAASPASPSPPRESGGALRMNATCGRKCAELLPSCGPVGCLGKMLLASSIWGSTKRFLTWQKRDTLFSHSYFRLAVSAHGMSASELLSSRLMFPTPLASDKSTCRDAANLDVYLSDNGIFRKRHGTIWKPFGGGGRRRHQDDLEPEPFGGGVLPDAGGIGGLPLHPETHGLPGQVPVQQSFGPGDPPGAAPVGEGGAEPRLGGMAHGLPAGMDGRILWAGEPEGVPRITEDTKDRALRLKTLGNAVCPPQAYPIFHYIAAIETGACASICPYGGGDG